MAESMVERLEAALKAASQANIWCDGLTDHEAAIYARAAIAAMREPPTVLESYAVEGGQTWAELWPLMVDVALATSSDAAAAE